MLEVFALLIIVFLAGAFISRFTGCLNRRTKVCVIAFDSDAATDPTIVPAAAPEPKPESKKVPIASRLAAAGASIDEVTSNKYIDILTELSSLATVKLKLLVCLKKTNYGTIQRFNKPLHGDQLGQGPYAVQATFVSHIKVEQPFDLSKPEDIRWAVHNLLSLANQTDCQLVDHVYECAVNHDPSHYPQYDSANLGELETLAHYNLEHIVYELREGENKGVQVIDNCDEWDYEDVLDGFNIGFEGVARSDDFESVEILRDHKYNGILISITGDEDKKATHRRFPLKSAIKALDFLKSMEGSKTREPPL